MKISIGHRLFGAVLLAILAVTATGIALTRHKVLASFADYAVEIELERLEELSDLLGRQYLARGDWSFIAANGPAERREWIASALGLLQQDRVTTAPPPPPAAPAAPAASPMAPMQARPAAPAMPATPDVSSPSQPGVPRPALPAPPAPPAAIALPPLPPLPPPPPLARTVSDGPAASDVPLQRRITLFDASGRYLAGNEPGLAPSVRRPVTANGQTVGYLAVARPLQPSDALALSFLGQLTDALMAIVAVSVGLSALAAGLLAAHFRKPVQTLTQGTRALAAGQFHTRLAIERSDELGELARHFNQLAERLESAERMRRDWVADTSHELRTPVSVLRAQIEAMLDGVRPATPENLEILARQVMALNKLIDELNILARLDVGALDYHKDALDPWELLVSEARSFEEKFRTAGLTLVIDGAPERHTVLADPDRLRQLFDNLLENSVRYTAAGGTVRLSATTSSASIRLNLDDSAPGVPDEALTRLTERFYRVDASRSRQGGGAGLGLSLCERIVAAHGGTLSFAQSPLGGLRVSVDLPLSSEAE